MGNINTSTISCNFTQAQRDRSIVTATHQVSFIIKRSTGFDCKDGGLFRNYKDKGVTLIYNLIKRSPRRYTMRERSQVTVHLSLLTPGEIYLFGVRYMGTKSSQQYIDDGQPGSYWSRVEYIKETVKLK